MPAITKTSDSLIGSLCREVDRMRQRYSQLAALSRTCSNPGLLQRLKAEWLQLEQRREELLSTARRWRQQRCCSDALGLEFLIELCERRGTAAQ